MKMFRLSFVAVAAGLLLSACSPLGAPKAANELYVLKAEAPVGNYALNTNLMVMEPEVAPGLNTPRIAVIDSPNHLTYYTGVAWAQELPRMMQQFWVDALQQSHAFKSVSSDKDAVFSQTALLLDVHNFEVDTSDAASNPVVRLRLVAKLINTTNHKVLATYPVEKRVAADAKKMPEIIAAFNKSVNEAVNDVMQQIARSCGSKTKNCL